MDILTLKNRITLNLPIYLEDKNVDIIEIIDLFNLVEVKNKNNQKSFVIDIGALTETPIKELSIPICFLANGR
ncbi:hypothetical protein FDA33_07170 [Clostridium botulinum]|uniref:hypothetical protein n=1 Tax=Clostridium botulinum TaxID=1491 RepID=UPI000773C7CF|nr:hypothetical protein [Clostridium botulinum]NFH89985.1 hypothetical protein [Clostridium botulinum]NFI19448.1 hypothetical protein [Clostridium botulinum]NFL92713.1 hypothetical protein [Clostridium botulinum]NFN51064.1 hypothetical protein [Clostridium botulinum]NFN95146.1 hypothetical protein [Clostridium botulinum]